mmetsp:Transcript_25776/g.75527  ORF Transcript_25776/g.75527 Transcript_25776/m.75527 type:complete len:267 (+) Transcript_25776:235-1035(+)
MFMGSSAVAAAAVGTPPVAAARTRGAWLGATCEHGLAPHGRESHGDRTRVARFSALERGRASGRALRVPGNERFPFRAQHVHLAPVLARFARGLEDLHEQLPCAFGLRVGWPEPPTPPFDDHADDVERALCLAEVVEEHVCERERGLEGGGVVRAKGGLLPLQALVEVVARCDRVTVLQEHRAQAVPGAERERVLFPKLPLRSGNHAARHLLRSAPLVAHAQVNRELAHGAQQLNVARKAQRKEGDAHLVDESVCLLCEAERGGDH